MYGRLDEAFGKKPSYDRLLPADDSESVSSEPKFSDDTRSRVRGRIWIPALVSISVISLSVVFLAGAWLGSFWRLDPNEFCIRRTSQYSPMLRDVDISYNPIRFNGSLMKENVYRHDAGPEVDAAWAGLGINYRSVIVPPDQAAQSGLLPDQVKLSSKYGGGYIANVEGLHHLHCLNLLRQSLYYNYDYYHARGEGAFKNDDNIVRYHVSHCLDMVRQQLMCTADIGVLGQVWWNPEAPAAYVDFNTRHKCRNFDDIRRWAEEHQAPENTPPDYLQPPAEGDTIYATLP